MNLKKKMEERKDYTESELKEKEKLEKDIKAIFNKDYIPYFLVKKANILYSKWKKITNWKESL